MSKNEVRNSEIKVEYDEFDNVVRISGVMYDENSRGNEVIIVTRASYRNWDWGVASSWTLPTDVQEAQRMLDLYNQVLALAKGQPPMHGHI